MRNQLHAQTLIKELTGMARPDWSPDQVKFEDVRRQMHIIGGRRSKLHMFLNYLMDKIEEMEAENGKS